MIKKALLKLVEKKDLTEQEMINTMEFIMEGGTSPAQIAAFLIALRMKGETIEEITGAARAMRKKAIKISVKTEGPIVDTCGTGGDGKHTFNVSTAVAFVVAGAGLNVAKHGNRSVSSKCGSADVLEALGINLDISPESVAECIDKVGIGFLFAQKLHPAMKYAASARSEIGLRTIFNILGPLTNPASATAQLLGVYDRSLINPLAYVLKNLGSRGALVVHGEGGYDEITITGKSYISELKQGKVIEYDIDPRDFGLNIASEEEIKGGDIKTNANILMKILGGKEKGAKYDMVLLNAAAAFKAASLVNDFKDGILLARKSIDSGKSLEKIEKLIE
jgi:anthranilate phosphoribosyltransferase